MVTVRVGGLSTNGSWLLRKDTAFLAEDLFRADL
jgi:hypothetical protein